MTSKHPLPSATSQQLPHVCSAPQPPSPVREASDSELPAPCPALLQLRPQPGGQHSLCSTARPPVSISCACSLQPPLHLPFLSPQPLSLTPGLHWLLLCYDCHRPSSLGYLPQLRAVIIHPGFESEGPGVQVQILTLGKSFTLSDLISVPSTVSWGKATEPPPQAGTQQTPLGCPLQSPWALQKALGGRDIEVEPYRTGGGRRFSLCKVFSGLAWASPGRDRGTGYWHPQASLLPLWFRPPPSPP